jgi:hypothetical protein
VFSSAVVRNKFLCTKVICSFEVTQSFHVPTFLLHEPQGSQRHVVSYVRTSVSERNTAAIFRHGTLVLLEVHISRIRYRPVEVSVLPVIFPIGFCNYYMCTRSVILAIFVCFKLFYLLNLIVFVLLKSVYLSINILFYQIVSRYCFRIVRHGLIIKYFIIYINFLLYFLNPTTT